MLAPTSDDGILALRREDRQLSEQMREHEGDGGERVELERQPETIHEHAGGMISGSIMHSLSLFHSCTHIHTGISRHLSN